MNTGRRSWKREPLSKKSSCSCGAESKLTKRRNFPHGRASKGRTTVEYVCATCKKRTPTH